MQTTQVLRELKRSELPVLSGMMQELGLSSFPGNAIVEGANPILRSPHRLAEATAYALLLEGMAAASIWHDRTKGVTDLRIALTDAIHSLHSTHFLEHSGYPLSVGAEYIPTNGLFKCKDGRFIMIESGPPYAKLERGYLNFFDCGNNRESIARSIAQFDSVELQEKLSELGLPACIAFTPEEWRRHPHGSVIAKMPVVEIIKMAEGKPRKFDADCKHALDGIKALDFTHVLAGPRSMRSLAQYGAEVLHVSSPYNRDTASQNMLVNMGKRSAYLLLTRDSDLAVMHKLLESADVFACSYRPSVAERFGLDAETLTRKYEGMICVSINAYGHAGPWTARPGFDQNGQVVTGFAATEGGAGAPRFSPVFYLNDFLSGYLAAAGTMAALRRRATEGGSYHVRVSLARTAMWVQDLGYIESAAYADAPEHDNYPPKLQSIETDLGTVTELAPPLAFSNMPVTKLTKLRGFGADKPQWC